MKVKQLVVVILVFLSTFGFASAQNWVYMTISQNTYIGDLNPISGSFYNPSSYSGQLGYSLGFERSFDETVSWFAEIAIGEYQGSYSLSSTVNRSEFSLNNEVRANMFIMGSFKSATVGFNWTYFSLSWISLYTGLGISAFDFSVKDLDGRNLRDVPLSRRPNENYPRIITSLPLKAGFMFFEKSNFNVSYELAWLFVNTDYLDNIGELGKPGSDAIFRNLIQVRYRLSKSSK